MAELPPGAALGLLETQGLVAAIEAADAMLKSAEVRLLQQQRTNPALITHVVTGETAAVRAAVDAGAAAAERVGRVVSKLVIPRPGDGLLDLIGAANANRSPNYNCAWLYENIGTNAEPDFSLLQTDFLTETMLDFGSATHPAFADINADGLTDLVVGTNGYNPDLGTRDARLFLLLNTGTAQNPAFTLTDNNWLNFRQFAADAPQSATYAFAPAFGDLDNDGDLDLLVGEESGAFFYVENVAAPGSPVQYENIIPQWQNLDVGQFSVPQIIDLDNDGLSDIVAGERNGNVNFLKNVGTPNTPLFNENENAPPNLNFIGQVNAAAPLEGFGNSAPHFADIDGELHLFLGTRTRGILVFSGIDPIDLAASFTPQTTAFVEIKEGIHTHAALFDLTGNGDLETIIGNFRGGLAAYATEMSTATAEIKREKSIKVFPNPVRNLLTVILPEGKTNVDFQILNSIGQRVKAGYFAEKNNRVSIGNLPSGIYFLQTGGMTVRFLKG